MKNSDNQNQNFSIQIAPLNLQNKHLSLPDSIMAVSNSNANPVVIGSVLPNTIHTSPTLLNANRTTGDLKSCNFIVAKSQTTSPNIVNQFALNTNSTIKFFKCQSINKDNSVLQNNAINLQILTNSASTSLNDLTPIKAENTQHNPSITSTYGSTTVSNVTFATSTSTSAISRRVLFQASQPQTIPNTTITIIPQSTEVCNNNVLANPLIKTQSLVLKGKQPTQNIRPIITQANLKPQINIISPTKSLNNLSQITTLSMSENTSTQDAVSIRCSSQLEEQKSQKTTPLKFPQGVQNSNIRLALTSNMPSKIQVISPKSRKRDASPIKLFQDSKPKDQSQINKEEKVSITNLASDNGSYSPTRKRARKQHLKSVTNKFSKPQTAKFLNRNNLESNANIRPAISEKSQTTNSMQSTPKIPLPPKSEDTISNTSNQIIIELKSPILCTNNRNSNSNVIQRPTSIFSSNQSHIPPSNSISSSPVQIITQNPTTKQFQLSPGSTNLILSPKSNKNSLAISPQKIYHISQCNSINNRITNLKNEKTMSDASNNVNIQTNDSKMGKESIENMKSEVVDVKSETSDENNFKFSLFPQRCNWNPRKYHFERELDVKIKKNRSTQKNVNYSSSNNFDKDGSGSECEVSDTKWFLYKASHQILLQKKFDEENLDKFKEMKLSLDNPEYHDDFKEPVFGRVCSQLDHSIKLPDQILEPSDSSFIDPRTFGIQDDIIDCSLNTLPKTPNSSPDNSSYQSPHECSNSCTYYYTEVSRSPCSPEFIRILDLIEGLIVKEKKLIDIESEVYGYCQKLLNNSQDGSYSNKEDQNFISDNSKNVKRR